MSGAAVCQEVSCQSRPGRTPPLAKKSLGKKGHVAGCIELTDAVWATEGGEFLVTLRDAA